MSHLVIIPCGAAKLAHPAPAMQLYTGSLFSAGLRWALSVAHEDQVLILSAKHGLVRLRTVLEPYEQFMGASGAISANAVREQAEAMGILARRVYALGGIHYRNVLSQVFEQIRFPVPAVGMGYQMQILKKNLGRLPRWSA